MDELLVLVFSMLQVVSRQRRTVIVREFMRRQEVFRRSRRRRRQTMMRFLTAMLANSCRRTDSEASSARRWTVPRSSSWWADIVSRWDNTPNGLGISAWIVKCSSFWVIRSECIYNAEVPFQTGSDWLFRSIRTRRQFTRSTITKLCLYVSYCLD